MSLASREAACAAAAKVEQSLRQGARGSVLSDRAVMWRRNVALRCAARTVSNWSFAVTFPLPLSARAATVVLVLLLQVAGCAKSGSSFDEDFQNGGEPPEGEGMGGAGGTGSPGSGPGDVSEELCGNGVIDGGEECDGAKTGGATCQSLGFSGGGALNCDPVTCTYDESMCRRPPGQGGAGMGG